MIFEGNIEVINAIKEKKRLMDAGESHAHIRPIVIMDGGFMKGAYGVGAAIAMSDLGFLKVFESYTGISSGAATLAYALAGQAHQGATVISEECCSKEFLNPFRWKNPEDTGFFQTVLEGATGKRLMAEKLISDGIEFFIGLSDFIHAKPFLLQPSTVEKYYAGIRASISMPGAANDPVSIEGTRYVDGASTDPHILSAVYEQLHFTHALIITNQDKHTKDILWWDKIITRTLWRFRLSPALRRAALCRYRSRHAWIDSILAHPPKPTCFSWGNGAITSFEQSGSKVKEVVETSRKWWIAQLEN